ncbi:MAG: transcription elongation factor GreA [Candidatus Jacksonbacteria bacterium]|jgi:transcription elongation factor GreA|nr:transcription elongation factor GreA [Candidatus Jacksonbacteria bacterium]MBT6034308.1 transcription elongation factor GreA [Candidatus Jacksonbacteria bacterium]MBT6301379.1 transcription elongation factor GreA [Candidatus Jacksonbacteria bacterium]MBT6757068.1 transcription elongation factor GreA [Candidatus Jacksonbacteria bacterium]MBT6954739.1 transcription elongation factor GreA [Candidatus Jacksonbacteria bacterium]
MTLTYVTKAGFETLTEELEDLKKVKRREIAQRIKEAKELGDLSENAEYASAKDDQSFNEGRIAELESMLQDVKIIKNTGKKGGKVDVGSKVKLKIDSEELEYMIVGSSEADPLNGRISNESPLGKAFLGKEVGSEVEIEVPAGKVVYTILEIG